MRISTYFKSHRKLFLVGTVFALIYMGNGAFNPYITLFYQQIGLTTSQIGVISSIGPLATLLLQTLWGRLADRTNRKMVLMLALLASGAIVLLYLLGTSYLYILAIALLYVIFNMSVLPMSDALALEYCTRARFRFAPIRMCGTIGYALMPILLGSLFSEHLTYTFYTYFAMCALAALATIFFPSSGQQRSSHLSSQTHKKASLGPLLRDPLVIFLLIANFVISIGVSIYSTYLSLYANSLGFDNNICGLLSAIAAISEIPTLLLIDKVLKKVKGQHIIIASSFFCGLRLLLTYLAAFCGRATLAVLIVGQLMQSVSYITNYYCSAQLIHERFPEELKSTAQTLLAMVTAGFSRIIANLAGGHLSEPNVLGMQNTYLFFAIFLFIGSGIVLLTYRFARRHNTQSLSSPM